jgi:hypothetical protein
LVLFVTAASAVPDASKVIVTAAAVTRNTDVKDLMTTTVRDTTAGSLIRRCALMHNLKL